MDKVAVVTGANQGLGLALTEGLCRTLGERATVYLTARDLARGRAAADELEAAGLHPSVHQLDVTSQESVEALASHLRARHGGVDIVISNAAARIVPERSQAEQVRTFVDTNNFGTTRMIESLGPLLRDGGRFLVVASAFGRASNLPAPLQPLFDREDLTLADIDAIMRDYVQLVEAGVASQQGWPDWINVPSKVAQVASMRTMARDLRAVAEARGLLVDAVCPGLVDTAASRPWFSDMSAAKSPRDAAQDLVWLATLPAGTTAPYGELVQYRNVIPWR